MSCLKDETKKCQKMRRLLHLKECTIKAKMALPILGLLSCVWMLIRLIPKPARATYPCMKVAFPIASSFICWVIGLFSSVFLFKKGRQWLVQSRVWIGVAFLFLSLGIGLFTFLKTDTPSYATSMDVPDPYGANHPIGTPKGILPGRVVWVHDAQATNEACKPTRYGDAYFLDKNCDQDVVDGMLSRALLALTNQTSETAAWDAVFQYFNENHGKGAVGYRAGETIFIKYNAVHAWTTNSDGSIANGSSYPNVDTSPQAILAMLRQLVNNAGVPEENIYIGDPYTHIFKHCLEKWRADFPHIHYMDNSGLDGREVYTPSDEYSLFFSDRGAVIDELKDKYYAEMENADYLLNIPAMKGHRWGGVTFFAKNFFGANTRSGANHMHDGLHRVDYGEPLRGEYGMYRVFVDLMAHKNLGGKSLIYFMDALWGCSYEHEPPHKFLMAPFNNDYSSSILLSLDPVAIASVGVDILQAEFPKTESEEEGNYWYPNFPAVDDYLHQAASSENWPEGIIYDPENDGTPVPSLGVHEHWNNAEERQYTRNLGTGEGIELVYMGTSSAVITQAANGLPEAMILHANYPNPFNPSTTIRYEVPTDAYVWLTINNTTGKQVAQLVHENQDAGMHEVLWNGQLKNGLMAPSGIYFAHLKIARDGKLAQQSMKLTLAK